MQFCLMLFIHCPKRYVYFFDKNVRMGNEIFGMEISVIRVKFIDFPDSGCQ